MQSAQVSTRHMITESDADLIIEDGGKIVPKMGGYSSVFQDLKNDEIAIFSRSGSLTVCYYVMYAIMLLILQLHVS